MHPSSQRIALALSLFLSTILLLTPPAALVAFELAYENRVYPGVVLRDSTSHIAESSLTLTVPSASLSLDVSWNIPVTALGVIIDEETTRKKLLEVGRSGVFRDDLRVKWRAYRSGVVVDPILTVNQKLVDDLAASVSATLDVPVVEPKFRLVGQKVVEFRQGSPGQSVDQKLLGNHVVTGALSSSVNTTIEIPLVAIAPTTTNGEVSAESLGVKERIGRGISRYRGSIASRKHNIKITAGRLDGVLIKPGDTFSFNDTVGDVSKETGYKEAYVIKDGRTVLGDGGGVCQDSTTLFRAVLAAGLPVVERRAHSYRVGYYEQDSSPGFDATVFAPTTDFKFKNDTPASILIQATADHTTDTLTIDLWGTSDGRTATTTKPVVTDVVPPPEDLYQDDPSLPSGQAKQVDWKAPGAKVTFTYTVTRSGEELFKKTFVSLYRPWQAVFLRGTGGVKWRHEEVTIQNQSHF